MELEWRVMGEVGRGCLAVTSDGEVLHKKRLLPC